MTRALRALALVVAVLFLATACAPRSSTGTSVAPSVLYGSTVQLGDIAPLVGDSSNWAPAPPTFGVRPLNVSTMLEQERYEITVRFTHSGTAEGLDAVYVVWNTASTARTVMDNISAALGTSLTGPKVGDQVLYFNRQQQVGAAPYDSETLVRVGQTMITLIWTHTLGFAPASDSGRIAAKVVSRLNRGMAARAGSAAAVDVALLPPPGPDLTLLGATRLPVQVVEALMNSPSPAALAKIFTDLGVSDFVYGDYTLDDDTHMEVRTAAFTFSSPTTATAWISAVIGAASLDQTGAYFNYDQAAAQYVAAFTGGAHGVLMFCKSSARFEAASRSCELPVTRVVGAWRGALSG